MIETPVTDDAEDDVGKKMMISGKILERMVNQNSCFEIAQGLYVYVNPILSGLI